MKQNQTTIINSKEPLLCDICHEKVEATFAIENHYDTEDWCIMCYAHRFGTHNAVRIFKQLEIANEL